MKTNYSLFFLLLAFILLNSNKLIAQSTEDFESETTNSTNFTDNGQAFTIINGLGETTYDIELFTNGGWNGTSSDNKFIDNSSGTPTLNDGSSFTISTTDGIEITVKSLYLFVSNRDITSAATTTLTITGKKDGATIYTIAKSSGIVNGSAFTPNNGFTFIDFSTEGGIDNSNINIDEIVFSTTGNADYLALDAFSWGVEVLSTNDFENTLNEIKIYPNPSSSHIQVNGIKESTEYKIYDILNKRVDSGNVNTNKNIDISKLKNGIYFISLNNKNSIKFIKN